MGWAWFFDHLGSTALGATMGLGAGAWRFFRRFHQLETVVLAIAGEPGKPGTGRLATMEADAQRRHVEVSGLLDKLRAEVLAELGEHDAAVADIRASQGDFAEDEEFRRFRDEEQRKWERMARLVGQLEGMLLPLPKDR